MSQHTPDAWIERNPADDGYDGPWCSACERHAEDCECNPDGDETVAEYEARQGLNFCSHEGCVDTAGTGGYCAEHLPPATQAEPLDKGPLEGELFVGDDLNAL